MTSPSQVRVVELEVEAEAEVEELFSNSKDRSISKVRCHVAGYKDLVPRSSFKMLFLFIMLFGVPRLIFRPEEQCLVP